ncbi:MAG: hypothetical protein ACREBG_01160, partial [Pyrinomonadaceae bacterium]
GRTVSGVNVPGRNVYLMIAGGSRVSLRQVDTSNVYEAADSSYLQLIDNGGSLLVRTTDGTQLSYQSFNNEWRCTQIKDRNGNYITVTYDGLGHITTIIDTLSRTITFNYDTNANLISITQSWTVNGVATLHTWASFGWSTKTLQPSFSGAMVVGANPAMLPVLSQVGLDDGSRYTFEYNAAGQLNPLRSYRSDNVERAYTAYDYDSPADDCPRLVDTHVWAQNWTGINGVPEEVATNYSAPGDGSHTVITPDGTLYKEFYGTGWQRGLTTQTEVWSGGVKQKWTTTSWMQDNTGVNYQTNPRVTESNIYDGTNRRRATVSYAGFTLPSGASCNLPADVREYAADATTVLRRSHTEYRMDPTADAEYLNRRLIGLAREQSLYEVNAGSETLMSRVGLYYDETGSIQGDDVPVRHDNDTSNGYRANFVIGRANLSSVKRYDVTDTSQFTSTSSKYNTAGSVVYTTDALLHHTTVSYADSFSDGNNGRNTLAYPKTFTDADGYSSTVIYNFDFGAVTSKQTPQPNTTQNLPGPVQTFAYDATGRVEKVTASTNNAYTKYVYGPDYVLTLSTVNNVADEANSTVVFDGLGRTVVAASNHPGSLGGYSARNTIYDSMGRPVKQSNPAETNGSWNPFGDDSGGWLYTQQTYDWKGRPLVTINPDGTTKEVGYTGCGCAGGAVVTLTDEGTLVNGIIKKRQQKIYSDTLGRNMKAEVLNWDGTIYSTVINTFNARDQVTRVRQYQGSDDSGIYQETTTSFDGYGRVQGRHVPEQDSGTSTSYAYNPDDSLQSVTDARGARATYSYSTNNRGLVSSITYSAPAGVSNTPNVSFGYDAAGNRISMTDGLGSASYAYDQLSQLTSESRNLDGLGPFTLSYQYNLAGDLKQITDATNMTILYGYDSAGRLNGVTGSDNLFAGVANYASNFQYRAWDGLKTMTDGSNRTSSLLYNSKLQPTHFEVSGGLVNQDYDYYNDGHIRFVHNTTDATFDRSYSYDHVARLSLATSGATARGEASGNTPYHETFGYDPWSNLTGRETTTWTLDPLADGATYTDNRRQGWGYDADGRNTTIGTRTYNYDSDGQMTLMTGQRWLVTHYVNTSQAMGYDGDGEEVKEVLAGLVTYHLRSSVLDDAIIAEINSSGQKTVGYVYSPDGELIAQQSGNQVTWKHTTPGKTAQYSTLADGSYSRVELDPLGADIGVTAPQPPDTGGGEGDIGGNHFGGIMDARWANLFDVSAGCSANGVAASCSGHMLQNNFDSEMRSFFGSGWYDLPGNNNEMARAEQEYSRMVQKAFSSNPPSKKKPKLKKRTKPPKKMTPKQRQEAEERRRQDAKKGNSEDYDSNESSTDGQLSPCLRSVLRPFFPQQSAQGRTYSPVDDARFKNWIPSWVKNTVDPYATTLGLYDIHYEPNQVSLNGGDLESLKTIVEEVSHTVQFIQLWAGLNPRRIFGPNVAGYDAAQVAWQNHYSYYVVKGFGYDNDVEAWAKKNVENVLTVLRARAAPNQSEICGFRLY